MRYKVKRIFPIIGMVLICGYATLAVIRKANRVQEVKQPLPSFVGDLAAARSVEIKDAAGQIVLSGNFAAESERNGEIEGKAPLTGAATNPAAHGEAEFEVSTKSGGGKAKELEFSLRGLAPATAYGIFLDGQQVATFSTDRRGAAQLELKDAEAK